MFDKFDVDYEKEDFLFISLIEMFLYTFTVIYKSYVDFPANNWLKIVVKNFAIFLPAEKQYMLCHKLIKSLKRSLFPNLGRVVFRS